jgi:CRP-like cAMP-binding protein
MLQVRNFFKENKFTEEELISIARKMEYKRLEPGDKVYRIKEESDYAYFIIKGEVMV